MNFRQIFDSYSSNTDASKRTSIISENKVLDGTTAFEINEFIDSLDDNKDDFSASSEPSSESVSDNTIDNNVLDDNILEALSKLDDSETSSNNDFKDKNEEVFEEEIVNNEDSKNLLEETGIDDLKISDQDDIQDLSPMDNMDSIEENLSDDIFPIGDDLGDLEDLSEELSADITSPTDSTDIESEADDSFLDDFDLGGEITDDLESYDFDDTEVFDEFFEDPLNNDSDSFDFDIENPDDLAQEALSNETPEEDLDSQELPDFSETDIDTDIFQDPDKFNDQELPPTDYENIDNSPDFNIQNFSQNDDSENISSLKLNDHQIFIVREHINNFKDKELRFRLRNIILEPVYHKDYFDSLISLLLINTPEEQVLKFLKENIKDHAENINTITPLEQDQRLSVFADDVIKFEEFKTNFTKQLRLISIIGVVISLLAGIAWFGIAQPIRVTSILEKGLIAIEESRFTDGESLFNQGMQAAGKTLPEWYVKYGNEYAKKELIQLAEQKYQSAIAIAPENIDIAITTSDFYTNMGIDEYPKAIKIMERISKIHPKDFRVWDYHSSLYISLGDFHTNNMELQKENYFEAAKILTTFINNNPKVSAPYYSMIDLYIKLGNDDQIRKITDILERTNPRYLNIEVLNQLVKYYIDRRNLDQSLKVFKQMVPFLDKYVNNIPDLQKGLGKMYNIPPENISNLLSESYYEYARFNILSSDIPKAVSIISNSIYLNSSNAKSYNLLGETFLASTSLNNRFLNAEELFNKALELDRDFYKPHVNLGHINYYRTFQIPTGSSANAIYHYKTAKALAPKTIQNFLLDYNLGWLEFQNDNTRVALNLWSDLYKHTPNHPTLNFAMGSALYKLNNPQLAEVMLQEASDIFDELRQNITTLNIDSPRHRDIFTQMAKVENNLGVINANYGLANLGRKDYFESQALLHFYNSQNLADQISMIYDVAEFNIGVLTRPNIPNRKTVFDLSIPKQTSLDNPTSEFNSQILKQI